MAPDFQLLHETRDVSTVRRRLVRLTREEWVSDSTAGGGKGEGPRTARAAGAHGADVNTASKNSTSALQWSYGHLGEIYGCALQFTVLRGNMNTVRLLPEKGRRRECGGRKTRQHVGGCKEIVRLLREHGAHEGECGALARTGGVRLGDRRALPEDSPSLGKKPKHGHVDGVGCEIHGLGVEGLAWSLCSYRRRRAPREETVARSLARVERDPGGTERSNGNGAKRRAATTPAGASRGWERQEEGKYRLRVPGARGGGGRRGGNDGGRARRIACCMISGERPGILAWWVSRWRRVSTRISSKIESSRERNAPSSLACTPRRRGYKATRGYSQGLAHCEGASVSREMSATNSKSAPQACPKPTWIAMGDDGASPSTADHFRRAHATPRLKPLLGLPSARIPKPRLHHGWRLMDAMKGGGGRLIDEISVVE
ncbi:hypothetical protein DFH06DRAFT_1435753 [Mycena polygramma]|nr:hypothetical protein DFH06DRAFT_1435753 [Mycena polygramma]